MTTTFQCRTLCNKHYERNANATVNSAYADMNEQCRTYEQCLILTYVDDVDIFTFTVTFAWDEVGVGWRGVGLRKFNHFRSLILRLTPSCA